MSIIITFYLVIPAVTFVHCVGERPGNACCLPQFNTFLDVSYSAEKQQFVAVGVCGSGDGCQLVYTSTDGGMSWKSNAAWSIHNVWLLEGVAYGTKTKKACLSSNRIHQ
jgi:hypothetical protein